MSLCDAGRLAVKSAGLQVELREILLRDKPCAFLAVSETATVPVLERTDGQVIEESRDIMFWALQQSGDPEQWLTGWKQDQAGLQAFLDQLDGPFKTHLDRYKYSARFAEDKADAAELASYHRAEGAAFLKQIDTRLNKNPFLNGSEAGLADYAALPFVRQFRIADITWFDDQDWPAVCISGCRLFWPASDLRPSCINIPPWKPEMRQWSFSCCLFSAVSGYRLPGSAQR